MPIKREIDKEKLFQKIMPSAVPEPQSGQSPPMAKKKTADTSLTAEVQAEAAEAKVITPPEEKEAIEPPIGIKLDTGTGIGLENSSVAETAEVSTAAEAYPGAEGNAARNIAETETGIPQQEPLQTEVFPLSVEPATRDLPPTEEDREPVAGSSNPHPVNLVELLLDRYYPIYRQRLNGCPCQQCRDDVFGIALNKVPPHYVASDRLDEIPIQDKELISQTVAAMVSALFLVKRNPHHGGADTMQN